MIIGCYSSGDEHYEIDCTYWFDKHSNMRILELAGEDFDGELSENAIRYCLAAAGNTEHAKNMSSVLCYIDPESVMAYVDETDRGADFKRRMKSWYRRVDREQHEIALMAGDEADRWD